MLRRLSTGGSCYWQISLASPVPAIGCFARIEALGEEPLLTRIADRAVDAGISGARPL